MTLVMYTAEILEECNDESGVELLLNSVSTPPFSLGLPAMEYVYQHIILILIILAKFFVVGISLQATFQVLVPYLNQPLGSRIYPTYLSIGYLKFGSAPQRRV